MKLAKLNFFDCAVIVLGLCILGVVAYRYATQNYLDAFGVFVYTLMSVGYISYRKRDGPRSAADKKSRWVVFKVSVFVVITVISAVMAYLSAL